MKTVASSVRLERPHATTNATRSEKCWVDIRRDHGWFGDSIFADER